MRQKILDRGTNGWDFPSFVSAYEGAGGARTMRGRALADPALGTNMALGMGWRENIFCVLSLWGWHVLSMGLQLLWPFSCLCAPCASPSGVSRGAPTRISSTSPYQCSLLKTLLFFPLFFFFFKENVSQAPDSKSNCMKREAFSTSHPTQIVSILIPNLLDKVFESCCFFCNMSIRKNSSRQWTWKSWNNNPTTQAFLENSSENNSALGHV